MSSGVSIEGEREQGKDVRSANGISILMQSAQPCRWPT